MSACIEIIGGVVTARINLTDSDLHNIGKFTRTNVSTWLELKAQTDQWVEILPIEDFHAVCNDIDIPWATKEGCDCYHRCYPTVQQGER